MPCGGRGARLATTVMVAGQRRRERWDGTHVDLGTACTQTGVTRAWLTRRARIRAAPALANVIDVVVRVNDADQRSQRFTCASLVCCGFRREIHRSSQGHELLRPGPCRWTRDGERLGRELRARARSVIRGADPPRLSRRVTLRALSGLCSVQAAAGAPRTAPRAAGAAPYAHAACRSACETQSTSVSDGVCC